LIPNPLDLPSKIYPFVKNSAVVLLIIMVANIIEFRTLEVKEVHIFGALDESAPEPIATRNIAEPGKPLIFFK
jgi:hypothetical protein